VIKEVQSIAINIVRRQSRDVAFLIVLILSGCVTPGPGGGGSQVDPPRQAVENEYVSASISPANFDYKRNAYKAFDLTIKNKTAVDIKLDWNKTIYIENNQLKGGFMFAGMAYEDRNKPKTPEVIFAGSELRKRIWPSVLVTYYIMWSHELIPPGHNGVYLTIKTQDKEINEKILLDMKSVLRSQ
jgi:hypothetical protein